MLRTVQSLPQEWAFDTGLRPRPFPDEAASLLPGPLAATRTGLTPASDDELTTQDQPPTRSTSCLWAHEKGSVKPHARAVLAPPPRRRELCRCQERKLCLEELEWRDRSRLRESRTFPFVGLNACQSWTFYAAFHELRLSELTEHVVSDN